MKQLPNSTSEIVGIIPCAGYATRISPLPCSKEIYPIGFFPGINSDKTEHRVISSFLLESLAIGGASLAYMILRKGKWDIPQYYGRGKAFRLPLSYISIEPTSGPVYTLDEAYPFVKGKQILFGFPDIFIRPKNAFLQLLQKQAESGADIVLGLFEAENHRKVDMVKTGLNGRVKQIIIKPVQTELTHTWLIASWGSAFTQLIHDFLLREEESIETDNSVKKEELHVGHVFQAAIDTGLKIETVTFSNGEYLDIGTPGDLKKVGEFLNP